MHRRIFITGGAGFIGSNFIRYLQRTHRDAPVLNFDKLTYAGNLKNLEDVQEGSDYTFVKGDICDRETVFKEFHRFAPDTVINFAAESHVDRSIIDSSEFIRTNIFGVKVLLDAAMKYGARKFIQISTDEVYGSLGPEGRFLESSPLNPRSPYSASKASADILALAYFSTYGLPITITRSSNNYGPYQFPEKLIPLTILHCLQKKEIPIYGDGMNIRDWIHVDDHCAAIDAVMEKGLAGEIYNIGADNELTNISLVKSIIERVSALHPNRGISEDLIAHVEDRPGHDRRYAIDSTKIRGDLGWRPAVRFEEGLRQTIQWYFDNPGWISSVLNRDYLVYYERNYGARKKIR